jgi:uncharacterized membrane protein YgcG
MKSILLSIFVIFFINILFNNELSNTLFLLYRENKVFSLFYFIVAFLFVWVPVLIFIVTIKLSLSYLYRLSEKNRSIIENDKSIDKEMKILSVFYIDIKIKKICLFLNKYFYKSMFLSLLLIVFLASNSARAEEASSTSNPKWNWNKEKISEHFTSLTKNDITVGFFSYLLGSTFTNSVSSPLSFSELDADRSNLSKQVQNSFENGLDLQVFDTVNYNKDKELKANLDFQPDSPLGWLCAILGWLYLAISLAVVTIGFVQTIALKTIASKANPRDLIQAVPMGTSIFVAIFLCAPIFKGFNILAVAAIKLMVIGIAIANFLMVGLLNVTDIRGASAYLPPSNSTSVFYALASKVACSMALNASSGNINKLSSINEYSTSTQLVNGFDIDFNGCGTLRFTRTFDVTDDGQAFTNRTTYAMNNAIQSVSQKYLADAGLSNEESELLNERVNSMYTIALKQLTNRIAYIYLDALEMGLNIEKLIRICDHVKVNQNPPKMFELSEENLKKIIKQCIISPSNLPAKIIEAQKEYNDSYRSIARYVQNTLESHTKQNSDMPIQERDFRRNFDLNNTESYGMFKGGWFLYPALQAISRQQSDSAAKFLTFSIENDESKRIIPTFYNPFSDPRNTPSNAAAIDGARGEALMQQLISLAMNHHKEITLADSIDEWNGGDASSEGLLNLPLEILIAKGLDGKLISYISDIVISKVTSGPNESLTTSMASSGHWMMNAGIVWASIQANLPSTTVLSLAGTAMQLSGVGAAAGTALKAFLPLLDKIIAIFDKLSYVGILFALVFPMIPVWFFSLALLKYIALIIKMFLITSLSAVKIVSNDSGEFAGKGLKDVIFMITLVPTFPALIVGMQYLIEKIAPPLVFMLQNLVRFTFDVTQAPYINGLTSMVFIICVLGAIPFLVLIYLHTSTLNLMDSTAQYLSLNLSVGNPGSGLSDLGSMSSIASSLQTQTNPSTGGGGGGGGDDGGGDDGGGGSFTKGEAAENMKTTAKNFQNVS